MGPRLPQGRCYGTTARKAALSGLILSENHFRPGLRIPPHAHCNAYFDIVLNGTQVETSGKRLRRYNPTTVAFSPPDEYHSEQVGDAGLRCLTVEIAAAWLTRFSHMPEILCRDAEFSGGVLHALGLKLYDEFRTSDALAPLAIEGLTLEILAVASRRYTSADGRRPPGWLQRAVDLLRARFTEPLSLATVAREVGVHPAHLAREFRRQYRCTVHEHLRALRVEFAQRAFTSSDAPVGAIALDAGFCHPSHLNRTFLRHVGMTPSAYRALARKSRR
jgi:AraC family transcriptional regulator